MRYNPEINYGTCFTGKLFGVDYNYEFYLHDEEYGNRVKKRGTRKQSDQDLRDSVYLEFYFNGKNILGFLISRIIYIGVRLFGWINWCKGGKMLSKNFSFKGWNKISWILGRKKMIITFVGMFCTWLAFDAELTGLLVGGAIFEGVWAAFEYFVKKVEY